MKNIITTILFAGAAASQLGSTDCGNVLADPGFDLWCGDALCDWKIERGSVQRVATWSAGDPGVSLVGTDVAIEQVTPVESGDGSCIEFDVIANIDPDTQVALNIDIFDDGSIERTEMLPSAPWQALAYRSQITGVFRGIRFEITKQGSGNAVLAQIGARIVSDCGDDPFTIVPAPAPLGAPCTDDSGCASTTCELTLLGQMCVACSDGTCPDGETCGLGDPTSPVRDLPRQCVADAARELGEQCLGDAECASGICTFAFGQPTISAPGGTYGSCSSVSSRSIIRVRTVGSAVRCGKPRTARSCAILGSTSVCTANRA